MCGERLALLSASLICGRPGPDRRASVQFNAKRIVSSRTTAHE